MKVDTHLTPDWHQIPDHIKKLEEQGYDGVKCVSTFIVLSCSTFALSYRF